MNAALSVTFADKKGGLVTIEFNADQFVGNIILRPKENENFIVHTNHPKYSEKYLIETWFNGDKGKANRMVSNTFWRQELAEDWLSASADKSVYEIQKLFRTYPILYTGSGNHDFRTSVSVVWNIREGAAYIAPDRPDLVEYERVTMRL